MPRRFFTLSRLKKDWEALPAPTNVYYNLDWLTLMGRPTRDPSRLFAKAGYQLREKNKDEDYKLSARGYSLENRLKVQLTEPSYDPKGNLISSGAYDVLFRPEHRQPKYNATDSLRKELAPEDLEKGQVTGGRWGDCTALDLADGFYANPSRNAVGSIPAPTAYADMTHESALKFFDRDDQYYSTIMPYSGSVVAAISWQNLIKGFGQDGASSRIDLALNLEYETLEDMRKVQGFLIKLCGIVFDRTISAPIRKKEYSLITAGKSNTRSPIKSANLVVSNGGTLYIGSRTSPFFARVYDKTADMKTKTGLDIPPTLRFEIECKKELADFCYKEILDFDGSSEEIVARLWKTCTDAYLTFGGKECANLLKIESYEPLPFKLEKRERRSARLSYTLKSQYGKAVREATSGLNDMETLVYIVKSLGMEEILPTTKDGAESFLTAVADAEKIVTQADKKYGKGENSDEE